VNRGYFDPFETRLPPKIITFSRGFQTSSTPISERSSGENNPNYGGKFKNDEWLMKQRISNSKKHLKVIDTLNNEEYVFINSKDVANFLSCDSGRVRTSKKYGWRIYKRYIIEDLITET
jgi:hypothetical protein